MPFFHTAELIAKAAIRHNYKKLLLLGTKFTVQDGFFAKILEDDGLEVIVQELADMDIISDILTEAGRGIFNPSYKEYFTALLAKYEGKVDAVVLACTELPLVISNDISKLPLIDPVILQCEVVTKFALRN